MPTTSSSLRRKTTRSVLQALALAQSLSLDDIVVRMEALGLGGLVRHLPRSMRAPSDVGVDGHRPLSAESIANPYPFYASLRQKAPVYKVPGADYYCVASYELVREVALDMETYSSNLVAILLASGRRKARMMRLPGRDAGPVDVLAIQDPPVHTRHRKLATAALSSRFQKSLDDEILTMVDELLAPHLAAGTCEWMWQVANVIPMRIALRLVGFPEEDHEHVKRLCDHAVALLSGVNTPAEFAEHVEQGTVLFAYVRKQFNMHLAKPGDNITGSLVHATKARGEDAMSEAEALSILLQILIAGSDSSASAMGSCVRRLVEDPTLQGRLRADPSLIPAFVEEVLRLEAPFQGHFRVTTRDVELGGVHLRKGTRLMLLWASANRDAAKFGDPDELQLGRKGLRQHMTFGYGAHLCLGAHLARREIQIAVGRLLETTLEVTTDETSAPGRHRASVFTRTLETLPLRLVPVPHRTAR